MKNKILFLSSILFLLFSANNSFARNMKLKSDDIESNKEIGEEFVFNNFGCKGSNLSPQLTISDVPVGTKSLAITMFDPDAPTGSGWWHWIVYNIDPTTINIARAATKISENAVVAKNDYGANAYGGPCPPAGTKHRYVFTLYALDITALDVPNDASAAMIGYYLNTHTIEKVILTPFYASKKEKK